MDTIKKKELFLEAYKQCGTIVQACRETGIGRTTIYMWRNDDPEFLKALDVAEDEATESLIAEARRRAHDGVDKPIYYKGSKVDTVKEFSDTLLMFLIKAKRPEYRDKNVTELQTPETGLNVKITVTEQAEVNPGGTDA
jgi:transposase-like protein